MRIAAPTTLDPGTTYTGDDAFVVSLVNPKSNTPLYQAYIEPWAEAVTAASGGRVEFKLYPDGDLVKEEFQYQQCLDGTVDITIFTPNCSPSYRPYWSLPALEVGELPGLFPNTAVAAKTVWTLLDEYESAGPTDVHVIALLPSQVRPYGSEPSFVEMLTLVMNKDKWESLPEAVQKAFNDASDIDAQVQYLADVDQMIASRGQKWKGELWDLSAAELAEMRVEAAPVWQGWVDSYGFGSDAQEILDRAVELADQYSAE